MFGYISASYQIVIFLLLFFVNSSAKKNHYHCNSPPSCGNFKNISYPFGLVGGPKDCGDPNYLLSCENNSTLVLHLFSGKYLVKAIDRENQTIRVVDPGFQLKYCSSLPLYPLTFYNFSVYRYRHRYFRYLDTYYLSELSSGRITFMNCDSQVNFNPSLVVETAPCVSGVPFPSTLKEDSYSYVMFGNTEVSEIPDMCRIDSATIVSSMNCGINKNCSYLDIYEKLLFGFELSWSDIFCEQCKGKGIAICHYKDDYSEFVRCYSFPLVIQILVFSFAALVNLAMAMVGRCFCGMPCVAAFLIYKWRRRHLSMYDTVEDFLRCHNNLMPIMYSFSDIKKMTRGFKEKLGEGGYGSVYKGKLSSGRAAAIKILGKSKANGQEFINEVATIGRIHHYNVVQLIGFCAERSKRALVYEYMPNGSLEKYIFSKDGDVSLSYEKLYQISLGIARGIEYLHRGCDMQILHFDIKPHNILLDENFIPKVSDFGLAKLYPAQGSIVSLTAPRGTMGYMAPELFYKNIGGVSYKADVYSFGMLLMEMAGRRKNLNAYAEHSSQIYFPTWVYDQFNEGKDIEIEDATEEERKITKKMLIVALWSIQMKPNDRPSMNRAVEMLEGEIESLRMPPRPFLSPQELHQLEAGINKKAAASSDSPNNSTDSAISVLNPA